MTLKIDWICFSPIFWFLFRDAIQILKEFDVFYYFLSLLFSFHLFFLFYLSSVSLLYLLSILFSHYFSVSSFLSLFIISWSISHFISFTFFSSLFIYLLFFPPFKSNFEEISYSQLSLSRAFYRAIHVLRNVIFKIFDNPLIS